MQFAINVTALILAGILGIVLLIPVVIYGIGFVVGLFNQWFFRGKW